MSMHSNRKRREDMSETARTSRIVLIFHFISVLALTFMGRHTYDVVNGEGVGRLFAVVYYTLLWLPGILAKAFFYHWCEKTKTIRDVLFIPTLVLYAFVLCTDRNPNCMCLIVPFIIIAIVYSSLRFSGLISGVAVILNTCYMLVPVIQGAASEDIRKVFYPYIVTFAVAFFSNLSAYVLSRKQKIGNQKILSERNRLKALAAVGIKRIFEYDIQNDVFMTSRSTQGEYGEERYIDNFSEVAKQYRYVLHADWKLFEEFLDDCRSGRLHVSKEMRLRDKNADYKWYLIKGSVMLDSMGMPQRVIGILENIDERKRLELRQADENMRDPLTKLYRKAYAKELIESFLKNQSDTEAGEYAGFLALDIDNFDIINERMGNAFGDEILKNIASDLEDIFYPTDVLGRIGGDEFIILMKNIGSIADIDKKIKEIQKIINRTYVGENVNFGSTVGIGASVYPNDGEDFDTLYDKAEKALFHAKKAGKNCYGFYDVTKEPVYSTYPIAEKREKLQQNEEAQKSLNHNTSDSLIELAFKLIDESKDTDSAINMLIRQVARQMNLGGIRIRVRNGKETKTTLAYQCCMVPDMNFDEGEVSYSLDQWGDMLEEYRVNNGIVACNDVMDIDSDMTRKLLLVDGIKSYVGCAFYDKGEFAGSMDFDDFNCSREWTSEELMNVRAVANVVSSYLLKMKAYEDASDTVERLTGYDGVTGLLMYEKFLAMTGEFIERAPHGRYAMVYMDFANFKYVNETYGYEIGDKVLRELAREADSYTDFFIYGSRVFSDNIVVLTKMGDRTEEELVRIFERVSERFADRMQKEYVDTRLILDIGVCTFEICGQPVPMKNIISNANMARKKAKQPDSPRIIVYNETMGAELNAEIAYANDMESAFRNHEFVVYMQPKVNLLSNHIEGAEALIRWKKQDGTLIFPNDFIPVFEKNKSITLLDYYVYDEVCKYLRKRIDQGKRIVRISMNVSRVHLFSIDEIVSYIKALINRYDIPPEYLEFELTETVFTDKVADTVNLMNKLRELGVMVSMDDFGSGYSSLNVLTKLPLDVLKLDKEFLDDFENDSDEKIIIPSVIDMAKKLNLSVVCEGVETNEQVAFLREVGCDYAQGYFYSKPVPQEQFDELLEIN